MQEEIAALRAAGVDLDVRDEDRPIEVADAADTPLKGATVVVTGAFADPDSGAKVARPEVVRLLEQAGATNGVVGQRVDDDAHRGRERRRGEDRQGGQARRRGRRPGPGLAVARRGRRAVSDARRLRGLHHVSAVTADAPGHHALLRGPARPARRQAHRRLRLARHLARLLRRRARDAGLARDVLRVPERRAAAAAGTTLAARLRLAVASEEELGALAERLAEAGVDLRAVRARGRWPSPIPTASSSMSVEIDAARDAGGLRLHGVTLHGDPEVDRATVLDLLGIAGDARVRAAPAPAGRGRARRGHDPPRRVDRRAR